MRWAAIALLLCCASGCGRVTRARQCQTLAREVNGALDGIDQRFRAGAKDAAALEAAATEYASLSSRLGTLPTADHDLTNAVAEYRRHFDRASRSTAALAKSLRGGTPAEAAEARRELDRVVKDDRKAATKVDDACRAP